MHQNKSEKPNHGVKDFAKLVTNKVSVFLQTCFKTLQSERKKRDTDSPVFLISNFKNWQNPKGLSINK